MSWIVSPPSHAVAVWGILADAEQGSAAAAGRGCICVEEEEQKQKEESERVESKAMCAAGKDIFRAQTPMSLIVCERVESKEFQ